MAKKTVRIATRKSPLAMWQAHHIRERLLQHWPSLHIELLPMVTSGDMFLKDRLSTIGGKGLFVKELEEALLDGRADLAVHSMKDVPVTLPEGLGLMSICKRQNPLDALVSHQYSSFTSLPHGAVIGTTSLRRQSQLLAIRPDLTIKPLRGNVQTRLEKLRLGEYNAIILAAAGLERLGMHETITEILTTELMLPACGQGALGLECRLDDKDLIKYLAPLNDPLTALCVDSERQVNARLGGNCHVPLAVYCCPQPEAHLLIRAKVATPDGKIIISNAQEGSHQEAIRLANKCADALLALGADELLQTPT